ncbi:MAG: hypothetical protein ACTSP4_00765 [Candidatus Hodarchaeales archaeon]
MLELKIDHVKKIMAEKNISGYWLEKETRQNREDYPIILTQVMISKVLNGYKKPSINFIKTLGLVFEVRWKSLLED